MNLIFNNDLDLVNFQNCNLFKFENQTFLEKRKIYQIENNLEIKIIKKILMIDFLKTYKIIKDDKNTNNFGKNMKVILNVKKFGNKLKILKNKESKKREFQKEFNNFCIKKIQILKSKSEEKENLKKYDNNNFEDNYKNYEEKEYFETDKNNINKYKDLNKINKLKKNDNKFVQKIKSIINLKIGVNNLEINENLEREFLDKDFHLEKIFEKDEILNEEYLNFINFENFTNQKNFKKILICNKLIDYKNYNKFNFKKFLGILESLNIESLKKSKLSILEIEKRIDIFIKRSNLLNKEEFLHFIKEYLNNF